jgi:hypothetical protein
MGDSMEHSASGLAQERLCSGHARVGGLPTACVFGRRSCPRTELMWFGLHGSFALVCRLMEVGGKLGRSTAALRRPSSTRSRPRSHGSRRVP